MAATLLLSPTWLSPSSAAPQAWPRAPLQAAPLDDWDDYYDDFEDYREDVYDDWEDAYEERLEALGARNPVLGALGRGYGGYFPDRRPRFGGGDPLLDRGYFGPPGGYGVYGTPFGPPYGYGPGLGGYRWGPYGGGLNLRFGRFGGLNIDW